MVHCRAVKTKLQIVLIRLFAGMDGYPIKLVLKNFQSVNQPTDFLKHTIFPLIEAGASISIVIFSDQAFI